MALFCFFSDEKRRVTPALFFLFVGVTLMAGFRDMIGGSDVIMYKYIFEEIPNNGLSVGFTEENGFLIYNLVVHFFSDDVYVFFFLTAVIISILHAIPIKKYSPIIGFVAFLMFCRLFLVSFVYLRQMIAMGILWSFAIPFISKRKLFPFLLIVLLASSFHVSALIFIPFYFLYTYQFSPKKVIVVSIIFAILVFTPIINGIILYVGSFMTQTSANKLEYYTADSGGNLLFLIEIFVLFFMLAYARNRNIPNLLINGVYLYCFTLFTIFLNSGFIRFSWYFILFPSIFLAYVYRDLEDEKSKKIFRLCVCIYFSIVFFRRLFFFDDGDMMPYKAFFQTFDRGGMWDE